MLNNKKICKIYLYICINIFIYIYNINCLLIFHHLKTSTPTPQINKFKAKSPKIMVKTPTFTIF
jgi:hypothetical protein